MNERPYLSIGEVLGLLLEEFPDITISKIRFLESQGLIDPERTASGYRKFYDADVERLRFILREQKENYLPLKVIRERLGDTPVGGLPRGIRNVIPVEQATDAASDAAPDDAPDDAPEPEPELEPAAVGAAAPAASAAAGDVEVPAAVTRSHPSARAASVVAELVEEPTVAQPAPAAKVPVAPVPTPSAVSADDTTSGMARVLATHMTRAELLEASGADGAVVDELEAYGLITPRTLGQQTVYEPAACTIAELASRFVALGIEVRHLKAWRTAAEREAGLFEQRILPLLRQRNPQARDQSLGILDDLVQLGGRMRTAMVEQALRRYIDPR